MTTTAYKTRNNPMSTKKLRWNSNMARNKIKFEHIRKATLELEGVQFVCFSAQIIKKHSNKSIL